MKNLRRRFEVFCFENRHKGIPNLMLYVVIGCAIVYVLSQIDQTNTLYYVLCFDRSAILHGQIWRLFTYVFTFNGGNILFTAVGLLCYFSLGRAMEHSWGTLRFNLFYLTGIVLMDIFAMIFSAPQFLTIHSGGIGYYLPPEFYQSMGAYLNLSLFLGYATLYPDTHFYLLFIIPVRAWIFALFYLGSTLYEVIRLSTPILLFPHNLFPLIALANYFLFFGKDIVNVLPLSWRIKLRQKRQKAATKTGTIPFPSGSNPKVKIIKVEPAYTHRCTICGRTDVSNPELEFRYCSRCNGYHCYCEEHISNHPHVE